LERGHLAATRGFLRWLAAFDVGYRRVARGRGSFYALAIGVIGN